METYKVMITRINPAFPSLIEAQSHLDALNKFTKSQSATQLQLGDKVAVYRRDRATKKVDFKWYDLVSLPHSFREDTSQNDKSIGRSSNEELDKAEQFQERVVVSLTKFAIDNLQNKIQSDDPDLSIEVISISPEPSLAFQRALKLGVIQKYHHTEMAAKETINFYLEGIESGKRFPMKTIVLENVPSLIKGSELYNLTAKLLATCRQAGIAFLVFTPQHF